MPKNKRINANRNPKAESKSLPLLQLSSDQNIFFALESLKERGVYVDELPDYQEIAAEIVRMGRPALDTKQISRCVIRLKKKGYIVTYHELKAIPA
jgi:hypothetical protein